MNTIYLIAYIEAWKIQDFKGVWTRELEIFALFALFFWALSPLCRSSYVKFATFAVIATVASAIQPLQINPFF